jgi:hypothetical protein
MTTATEPIERAAGAITGAAATEAQQYAHGERRPLGGYLVLLSVYGTIHATLGTLARRRGALPERFGAGDLALLAVGTHKLSRLITKDSVTAVFRAPFTTYVEPSGEGEVHEEVRGEGVRHAAGELVTCPFCIAVWVATLLSYGLVLAPRATRLVASILTAVTTSDYLQMAYAITQRAVHDG